MKNRLMCFLVTICLLVSVFGSGCFTNGNTMSFVNETKPGSSGSEKQNQSESCVEKVHGTDVAETFCKKNWLNLSEKDKEYNIQSAKELCSDYGISATEEQTEALAMLEADSLRRWVRPKQIILGLLPEDQPRITLEEAETVILQVVSGTDRSQWDANIAEGLGQVAGYADFTIGSGMITAFFATDDSMTNFVMVNDFGAVYAELDMEKSEVRSSHLIANFLPEQEDADVAEFITSFCNVLFYK